MNLKHYWVAAILMTLNPLLNAQEINLALGKQAESSSHESPAYQSKMAFDGDLESRWSSNFLDSQWLQVDLGELNLISAIILNWETAYASIYEIQLSNNGQQWSIVHREDQSDGQIDSIIFSNQWARYVRMFGIQRATTYGFSLYEMEVYGPGNPSDARIRKILLNQEEMSHFSSDVYDYDELLEPGISEHPQIEVIPTHPDATYVIENPVSLPGTSRITVTSPDQTEQLVYHIRWIPSTLVLLWADEFNDDGKVYLEGQINAVDSNKWFHQTELPNGRSWFNGEVQHYTNRTANAYVSNGSLNVVAKRERYTDQGRSKDFTSARLNSKAVFPITRGYGKIEFRAKLPKGAGTWPAVWTLGQNINERGAYWQQQGYGNTSWPACGEIDIMEHWGDNENHVTSAIHTPSNFGGTVNKGAQFVPTATSAFHLYSLEWSPDKLDFKVDGNLHYTYAPEVKDEQTWPFDIPHYLLINIAIEGDIDANGPIFQETQIEIDYIRVYEQRLASEHVISLPSAVRLYPNPSKSHFLIDANQQISEVRIHDLQGREYYREAPGTMRQMVEHSLPPALYVVSIKINDEWIRKKISVP